MKIPSQLPLRFPSPTRTLVEALDWMGPIEPTEKVTLSYPPPATTEARARQGRVVPLPSLPLLWLSDYF